MEIISTLISVGMAPRGPEGDAVGPDAAVDLDRDVPQVPRVEHIGAAAQMRDDQRDVLVLFGPLEK